MAAIVADWEANGVPNPPCMACKEVKHPVPQPPALERWEIYGPGRWM